MEAAKGERARRGRARPARQRGVDEEELCWLELFELFEVEDCPPLRSLDDLLELFQRLPPEL